MKITPKLQQGILIRRYKRFLADIRTEDGNTLTVHCPNTGSMRNCLQPEKPCWYSLSDNAKRKYPHTLEIVTASGNHRAGINTGRANHLVKEAITDGTIAELSHYQTIKPETVCGIDNSRMDFLLTDSDQDQRDCFVEVKNVTLMEQKGCGYFPDAVSTRGAKHLRALTELVQQGKRAVLLFCVQHAGITSVAPADHIDPEYGRLLRVAASEGVEILAYQAKLTVTDIRLYRSLPIILDEPAIVPLSQ